MADWYVSSAAYSGYTAFAGSHVYSIGDLIVPTAPALKAKWVFRCTTAGTSTTEPAWNTANNGTSTSGTAIFTNVTGQSSFFWSAAAGDLPTLLVGTRIIIGDRVFVSSDHTETQTTGTSYGTISTGAGIGYGNALFLSVNRAGSTPPVAADLTVGATLINSSGGLNLTSWTDLYFYGFIFIDTGSSNLAVDKFGVVYLSNCQVFFNSLSAIKINGASANAGSNLIMDNTTVQFGATGQFIGADTCLETLWQGTASAFPGAIFPTTLFSSNGGSLTQLSTTRGVDLSALTTTLVDNSGGAGSRFLFDSCKIASGVTRYRTSGASNPRDVVEFVNCYDGTNIISELYAPNGNLTTEFTITLSGGATDNIGTFSHKMVSNANIDKFVYPMCSFWMDVGNTLIGSSRTATVEIISSTALNNDEIALYLEYMGTIGTSVTSFADCFAGPLATPAAVTTSTATWNSSPATPQKQKLQVTFTPQRAGRVRGQVRLGKASATVYVNPQITIT